MPVFEDSRVDPRFRRHGWAGPYRHAIASANSVVCQPDCPGLMVEDPSHQIDLRHMQEYRARPLRIARGDGEAAMASCSSNVRVRRRTSRLVIHQKKLYARRSSTQHVHVRTWEKFRTASAIFCFAIRRITSLPRTHLVRPLSPGKSLPLADYYRPMVLQRCDSTSCLRLEKNPWRSKTKTSPARDNLKASPLQGMSHQVAK